jgi:hypothetical protein
MFVSTYVTIILMQRLAFVIDFSEVCFIYCLLTFPLIV